MYECCPATPLMNWLGNLEKVSTTRKFDFSLHRIREKTRHHRKLPAPCIKPSNATRHKSSLVRSRCRFLGPAPLTRQACASTRYRPSDLNPSRSQKPTLRACTRTTKECLSIVFTKGSRSYIMS